MLLALTKIQPILKQFLLNTNRGSKVIEARGKSSALSAANAIANHLRDWLSCPTGATEAVSMGVFSDGNPYGVPEGLVYSFPVECGGGAYVRTSGRWHGRVADGDRSVHVLVENVSAARD